MIIAMSFSKADSQRVRLIPLVLVVSRPAFVERLSDTTESVFLEHSSQR